MTFTRADSVRPAKAQYSEMEAAEELGLSVEQFRRLLRSHIVDSDEELTHASVTSFHPSDLLVLKLLAGVSKQPETAD